MTKQRKLKRRIRDRMDRTGESYTAARKAILEARDRDTKPEKERTP